MEFFVDFAELLVCYVSIYLRCCNRGVAEHRLDGTDIGAVAQKVGGIAMAQGVG